ncbi:hypothetical protein J1614_004986 [Plenodomus biglobosus]|nr:hypothetical protein J1614_004986 [Plenodomus biglobosus]
MPGSIQKARDATRDRGSPSCAIPITTAAAHLLFCNPRHSSPSNPADKMRAKWRKKRVRRLKRKRRKTRARSK